MMAPKNGVNELSNLGFFLGLFQQLWGWWIELGGMNWIIFSEDWWDTWIPAWKIEERCFETIICELTKKNKDRIIGYVNLHSWFMFLKYIFWCQVWKHPTTSNNHNNSNGNFGTATAFFSRSARAHLHHLPLCHPTLRHGTTACPSGEL